MALALPSPLLEETFAHFRSCGAGHAECQALWVGPWSHPETITEVIHPQHDASAVGFDLEPEWMARFWRDLADRKMGVRVQVHTHPGAAYHSATDDAFPIIHTPGFLSLVIPRFGLGPIGFERAFLAQIQPGGGWREVSIADHLELVQ